MLVAVVALVVVAGAVAGTVRALAGTPDVPPADAGRPGDVPLQSVCPGVSIGHGQLPTDPLVVGIVLRTCAAPPSARRAPPIAVRFRPSPVPVRSKPRHRLHLRYGMRAIFTSYRDIAMLTVRACLKSAFPQVACLAVRFSG